MARRDWNVPVILALWLVSCLSSSFASEAVPTAGLQLHLDASRDVEVVDGRVARWSDLSGKGHQAMVPSEYAAPTYVARSDALGGLPMLTFHDRQLLRIATRVLPESTRRMTVMAVAKSGGPNGVGIFSSRSGTVPLVQLDTDSNGDARFIVRDRKRQTLESLGRQLFGRWGVYTGVLEKTEQDNGRIEVFFGSLAGSVGEGRFDTPITSDTQWIGALPLGDRVLSWNGAIAEILVYDRALASSEWERLARHLCRKYGLTYEIDPSDQAATVYPWEIEPKPVAAELSTDICVVGGGSGGIGAALAAARQGAEVVLVERQSRLGGTGVNALVSAWEPGPGCSIAQEIFERMSRLPDTIGVAGRHPNSATTFPMGQWYIVPGVPYERSLRRANVPSDLLHSVPYDPVVFGQVVREMCEETDRVKVLDDTTFFFAQADDAGTHVESILVEDAQGRVTRIRAKVFIDCTGCAHLCRAIGCEVMLGVDPRDRFNEPSAPVSGSLQLNAISRCYMVRPSKSPHQELPIKPPAPYFAKCAHVTGWKDGRRVINPLPMLPGRALIDYGYVQCMEMTDKAVRAQWRWLQQAPDFEGYEFDRAAPMLGIRESYRVVTRYVLNEHDLASGLSRQKHEDIIAIADHPCDIHGAGGHLTSVAGPYGIPYRCLIPEGNWENLLVACRGAGFSKIAASSCRLQRTMIQIGHAAGMAAAMAAGADVAVDRIDLDTLVSRLDAKSRYPQP